MAATKPSTKSREKKVKASIAAFKEERFRTRVLPIADLLPADYNPRKITPHALEGLKASLREFGYVEPIVWNERTGNVVGGHQRRDALAATGSTHVEVVVVDLDEAQERALNVTLNNPAIQGTWDDGKLQEILGNLRVEVDEGAFASSFFEDVHLDELAATFDSPPSGEGLGSGMGSGEGEGDGERGESTPPAKLIHLAQVFVPVAQLPQWEKALSVLRKQGYATASDAVIASVMKAADLVE